MTGLTPEFRCMFESEMKTAVKRIDRNLSRFSFYNVEWMTLIRQLSGITRITDDRWFWETRVEDRLGIGGFSDAYMLVDNLFDRVKTVSRSVCEELYRRGVFVYVVPDEDDIAWIEMKHCEPVHRDPTTWSPRGWYRFMEDEA